MRIDGLDPSLTTPAAAAAATPAPRDEFLKLLVAQLRHQDPLEPQKGSEFVAQLAQFASLEQSAETNQRLAALATSQSSAGSAAYAGLVGRTVTARTGQVSVEAGAPPSLAAHLDGAASAVQVVISDASGRAVRTIDLGARPAGDVDVAWDGKDGSGAAVPPGTYTIEVKASGTDGAPVSSFAAVRGVVRSLEFTGGAPRFRIGSASVAPADIIAIHG